MGGVSSPRVRRVSIGAADYFVAEYPYVAENPVAEHWLTSPPAAAGARLPVLLLHGFPETHLCWSAVAPRLAEVAPVVTPDLRGYGASSAPPGGPHGEGYSKREMANELVALMDALGHPRFAVVGHDRGARVAYRLALDHPELVSRAAVVNVVPTVDQFALMGSGPSLGYWPWFLLAQPPPYPERMLAADPAAVLDLIFSTWTSDPEIVPAEHRRAYREAWSADTIAAICADYRASFHIDVRHDEQDRSEGVRISAPLLLVTSRDERQLADAPAIWDRWADRLTCKQVDGGHFAPEEAAGGLAELLADFLTGEEPVEQGNETRSGRGARRG
jgi:haloacetate dehalogenase